MRLGAALIAMLALTACEAEPVDLDRPETAREFPRAYRPVSDLGKTSVSTEQARDDRNEAQTVMDLAQIRPGMTVADIGAGEGYYTVRLAERVGESGRVLAQDIDQDALRRHEVTEPYAFLWRLRPALREGGQVIVVDVDRPTDQHGISPALLFCEFHQVGFRLVEFVRKPELAGYYAQFVVEGPRPEPGEIVPCRQQGSNKGTASQ